MSVQTAKSQVGELLITGVPGLELTPDARSFLHDAAIGGVIYFGHNYESAAQIAEFSQAIQSGRPPSRPPLWISVDHEGGRVQRFKKGFTKIPEAIQLAASGSPKALFEISELIARELKAVGVNLNFAPIADINTNPKNPVIGNRAFGVTEDEVSKAVSAFVRGHLTVGVQPCVKHFPGHGDTATDSHFALPKVSFTEEQMRTREMEPFAKAFRSRCQFVMTAHIVCTAIDPNHPATLSNKILRQILRQDLRFNGLIVSDDMEMKAITDHFGVADAPRLALQAGCDLLIYRSLPAARAAHAALIADLDFGRLAPEIVIEAANRSQALKREVLLPETKISVQDLPKLVGTEQNAAIAARFAPPIKPTP